MCTFKCVCGRNVIRAVEFADSLCYECLIKKFLAKKLDN